MAHDFLSRPQIELIVHVLQRWKKKEVATERGTYLVLG